MREAVLLMGWAFGLGVLAQRAARRREIVLDSTAFYWLGATTVVAAVAAGSMQVKLSVLVALLAIAVAAIVDSQTGYIFDPLVQAGAIGALTIAALEGEAFQSLYGAVVASVAVLCIWALTLGRGIGMGDVKLAAVVGAAFGPLGGIVAIGFSFVVGAAVAIPRIIARKAHFGTSIRFGPYLLAGSVCFLAYHRLSNGVIP